MLVHLEIRRDEQETVQGAVVTADRRETFSGWLDLLRLLETALARPGLDGPGAAVPPYPSPRPERSS